MQKPQATSIEGLGQTFESLIAYIEKRADTLETIKMHLMPDYNWVADDVLDRYHHPPAFAVPVTLNLLGKPLEPLKVSWSSRPTALFWPFLVGSEASCPGGGGVLQTY